MGQHELRHTIDCDVERYWRLIFDEEYNRKLYLEALGFRRFEMRENTTEGDLRRRRMFLDPPPADLPGPIAKLAGDLSWTEEGTYDAKTGRYRLKVRTSSLTEKIKIEGTVVCNALGPKRLERVTSVSVEVNVFMVGSMLEKRIVDDMKKSNDQAAIFTSRYPEG